uniref:Uncharacterized protein n=1 Tax=Pipistrellus kuhlii TaxID=59472 RepID=A0A7J7SFH6_PIPKU|nr:hypothetical protein mPipKuh1_009977 [Pipistrellus kuhlii]
MDRMSRLLPGLPSRASAAKERRPQSWDNRASCPGDQGAPSAPPAPPATAPQAQSHLMDWSLPVGASGGLWPGPLRCRPEGRPPGRPVTCSVGLPVRSSGLTAAFAIPLLFFRPTCLYSDRQLCSAVGCRGGERLLSWAGTGRGWVCWGFPRCRVPSPEGFWGECFGLTPLLSFGSDPPPPEALGAVGWRGCTQAQSGFGLVAQGDVCLDRVTGAEGKCQLPAGRAEGKGGGQGQGQGQGQLALTALAGLCSICFTWWPVSLGK